MALVTEDGKIYPLIKDDGSKMFFTDAKVRNRPMRLTARLFANTQLLQVVNVHSYKDGKLHDIYYWCDHLHHLARTARLVSVNACGRSAGIARSAFTL